MAVPLGHVGVQTPSLEGSNTDANAQLVAAALRTLQAKIAQGYVPTAAEQQWLADMIITYQPGRGGQPGSLQFPSWWDVNGPVVLAAAGIVTAGVLAGVISPAAAASAGDPVATVADASGGAGAAGVGASDVGAGAVAPAADTALASSPITDLTATVPSVAPSGAVAAGSAAPVGTLATDDAGNVLTGPTDAAGNPTNISTPPAPTTLGVSNALWPSVLGSAGSVIGGLVQANAAGNAANINAQAAANALAFEKQVYADRKAALAPYVAAGDAASAKMSNLIGTGGPSPSANAAGATAAQVVTPVSVNASTPGVTVLPGGGFSASVTPTGQVIPPSTTSPNGTTPITNLAAPTSSTAPATTGPPVGSGNIAKVGETRVIAGQTATWNGEGWVAQGNAA